MYLSFLSENCGLVWTLATINGMILCFGFGRWNTFIMTSVFAICHSLDNWIIHENQLFLEWKIIHQLHVKVAYSPFTSKMYYTSSHQLKLLGMISMSLFKILIKLLKPILDLRLALIKFYIIWLSYNCTSQVFSHLGR